MDWVKFAEIAKLVAPIIVSIVVPKLAPVASTIGHAIGVAEKLPDATGSEKLDYVKQITHDAVVSINEAASDDLIDETDLQSAIEHGVNTSVAVINLINKSKNTPIQ